MQQLQNFLRVVALSTLVSKSGALRVAENASMTVAVPLRAPTKLNLAAKCDASWPALTSQHTLICKGNAFILPKNVYTRMTIGGDFLSSSGGGSKVCNGQVIVEGDYSTVTKYWNFNGPGISNGLFSDVFDWSDFELLAKTLVNSTDGNYRVFVFEKGGTYSNDAWNREAQSADNGQTLFVFNTDEEIILKRSSLGRAFGPSVLAPFSKVTLDKNAGYVDGIVIAREANMLGSSNQMHGKVYKGKLCTTDAPTMSPTSSPTSSPTMSPSSSPTASPTSSPTMSPSSSPTLSPTSSPTMSPSLSPTTSPTSSPSMSPSASPTTSPTSSPTMSPSASPTSSPTMSPSSSPTANPTSSPTSSPTMSPSSSPTLSPSSSPTMSPSLSPTTSPTSSPTMSPSASPTTSPTSSPTMSPTSSPTSSPTMSPSSSPTMSPTSSPTMSPTSSPTSSPSMSPSASPTTSPTSSPTMSPSASPTSNPTSSPTSSPTMSPSSSPTLSPTSSPTMSPTTSPTSSPTMIPSSSPTANPSSSPTLSPSSSPTLIPTSTPTKSPTYGVKPYVPPISGSGDPHLVNVRSEHFDVMQPGNFTFLMMPRGASVETADLRLRAQVTARGDVCAGKLYITRLIVTGKWLGATKRLSFYTGGEAMKSAEAVGLGMGWSANMSVEDFIAAAPPKLVTVTQYQPLAGPSDLALNKHVTMLSVKLQLGPGVIMRVDWEHQKEKVGFSNWLKLNSWGLGRAGMEVGGLLGQDDHGQIMAPPKQCLVGGPRADLIDTGREAAVRQPVARASIGDLDSA